MLLTTTANLPNLSIIRYFGVISATTFIGSEEREIYMTALEAAADGITTPLERLEQEARRQAIDLLRYKATELNADAIVGLQIDHRVIDPARNLVMIFAAGTAVQTSQKSREMEMRGSGQPGW